MKVSVIIPAHNPGPLLRDTLASGLAQEDADTEILVIDDGSTDGTPDLLASYGSRIRVERFGEGHGDGTFARNHGLAVCRGEAVKFLDHDDVLEPGVLAREAAELDARDADLVMSGWGICSLGADGRVDEGSRKTYEPPAVDELVEAILGERKTPFTAAVLYRKALIQSVRWDADVAMYDDFDFFSRAALGARRIARLPGVAYWWRQHGASFQSRIGDRPLSHLEAERTRCRIYLKLEPMLEARGDLTPRRRRLLARAYYKGLRAFALWDPNFCRRIERRIEALVPGFRPTPQEEPVRAIQMCIRILGIRPTLRLYRALRRGAPGRTAG